MKPNARKWLRWLFTFALVLGLVSALGLTTLANGGDGTSASQAIEIGTWDDLAAALAMNATNKRTDETADSPTYYKLTANCARENSTSHIVVGYGRSVTLDLNGYGIKANPTAENRFSVINVQETATLNLTDSGNTEHYCYLDENGLAHVVESTADENYAAAAADKQGSFTGGYLTGGSGSPFSANGVTYYIGGGVQSYGTFNMAGGTILGNACDNGGGVCNINSGKFTMTGGAILGNTANDYGGGGVFIFDPGRLGSTFIMDGGTISYNSALGDPFDENDLVYGGGVYNFGGTFNMNGGTISYNNASTGGGGVENYNGATFTMTGGTISYNEATYGGGMENNSISTFTMSGGTIEHNTVTYCGGGMANYTNSTFTMSGGTLSYNQAIYGGGVENGTGNKGDNSRFIMSGGTISYNTASSVGSSGGAAGGVENCATFTMSGQATITNNGAKAGAGVVNYAGGTFTMTGGTISYNQASLRSGGVENASKGTFTMTGGTISYNKANSNGGVFNSGATFSMSGGTIAHNEAKFNGGGVGVSGGTFSMSGEAAITNNNVVNSNGGNGGGVYLMSGTFSLSGEAAISDNTATMNGAGVYFMGGVMQVSGGARVAGNQDQSSEANNVYLPEGCRISVTGALTDGASIGIRAAKSAIVATGVSADSLGYFHSDTTFTLALTDGDKVVAAAAVTEPTTWSELQTALTGGGFVRLANDVKFGEGGGEHANDALTIGSGVSVILDLNGHTIDRGLSGKAAVENGGVITISGGTLTLTDSADNGTITGGNTTGDGGGVYVGSNATFTMENGTISGCTANSGGGVYLLNTGWMEVSGDVRVTGNKDQSSEANNVYLPDGCRISVTGALTDSARIGVTMQTPGLFTYGLKANVADAPLGSANNFLFDNGANVIFIATNGEAAACSMSGSFDDNGKLVATFIAPKNSLLIAAAYEESSGKMADAESFTITAMNAVTYTFTDLETGTGYTYKLMLVNAATCAPLCTAWAKSS